jgi:hypothetical protein
MFQGDLNKWPWENYLEGGGSEEIIKSSLFCKMHYVLSSDINEHRPHYIPMTFHSHDEYFFLNINEESSEEIGRRTAQPGLPLVTLVGS